MKIATFLFFLSISVGSISSNEKTLYEYKSAWTDKNMPASKAELESFLHFSYLVTKFSVLSAYCIYIPLIIAPPTRTKTEKCGFVLIAAGLILLKTIQDKVQIRLLLAKGPTAENPHSNNANSKQ